MRVENSLEEFSRRRRLSLMDAILELLVAHSRDFESGLQLGDLQIRLGKLARHVFQLHLEIFDSARRLLFETVDILLQLRFDSPRDFQLPLLVRERFASCRELSCNAFEMKSEASDLGSRMSLRTVQFDAAADEIQQGRLMPVLLFSQSFRGLGRRRRLRSWRRDAPDGFPNGVDSIGMKRILPDLRGIRCHR